jgi:hypothetical protein
MIARQAVRWLPITSCYQCDNRDAMACRCLLTTRKRNRHPAEGIPEWCPLPNAEAHGRAVSPYRAASCWQS